MQKENVIDKSTVGNNVIEIVELAELDGATSGYTAQQLFFMRQAGVTLKFVRVHLAEGELTTEAGAFYYSKGRIQNNVETGGVGGVAKKLFNSALTKETAFNPKYSGVGEVVLEPTFKHFILLDMKEQSFIVDKGMYYCSVGNIKVETVIQRNVSSALAGGEGLFQTSISGTGAVVLSLDVPMTEIQMYELNNEMVQVDGNFAILRESTVRFDVRKSTKSLFGSVVGGEGLLQTFEGTGKVWIAPTAPVYNRMAFMGMSAVNVQGNSHNIQ